MPRPHPVVPGKFQVRIHSQRLPKRSNSAVTQINRTQKISRQDLTHKLGLKEKAHQPVLISLVNADEKVLKPSNATTSKEPNKAAAVSSSAAAK